MTRPMAVKVDRVRPRSERDIPTEVIAYAPPDDPPRRVSGAGWVVICVVALGAFVYAVGSAAAIPGCR